MRDTVDVMDVTEAVRLMAMSKVSLADDEENAKARKRQTRDPQKEVFDTLKEMWTKKYVSQSKKRKADAIVIPHDELENRLKRRLKANEIRSALDNLENLTIIRKEEGGYMLVEADV